MQSSNTDKPDVYQQQTELTTLQKLQKPLFVFIERNWVKVIFKNIRKKQQQKNPSQTLNHTSCLSLKKIKFLKGKGKDTFSRINTFSEAF